MQTMAALDFTPSRTHRLVQQFPYRCWISFLCIGLRCPRCLPCGSLQVPCNALTTVSHRSPGSGSACRSLFGGFVAWEMGAKADGTDSYAVEVAPREHWPDMHALSQTTRRARLRRQGCREQLRHLPFSSIASKRSCPSVWRP